MAEQVKRICRLFKMKITDLPIFYVEYYRSVKNTSCSCVSLMCFNEYVIHTQAISSLNSILAEYLIPSSVFQKPISSNYLFSHFFNI